MLDGTAESSPKRAESGTAPRAPCDSVLSTLAPVRLLAEPTRARASDGRDDEFDAAVKVSAAASSAVDTGTALAVADASAGASAARSGDGSSEESDAVGARGAALKTAATSGCGAGVAAQHWTHARKRTIDAAGSKKTSVNGAHESHAHPPHKRLRRAGRKRMGGESCG